MQRITGSTVDEDKFGSGKDGFTDGNPYDPGSATIINEDWLDGVQEELVGLIEAAGLTPSNGDYTQLAASLLAKVGSVYAAAAPVEFDGIGDTQARIVDGNAPTGDRYVAASFGVFGAAQIEVYFSDTAIEFAYNCFWTEGVGWSGNGGGGEGVVSLRPTYLGTGPNIEFWSDFNAGSNSFDSVARIRGNPSELISTPLADTIYPMCVTKVMGEVYVAGGNTTCSLTGAHGISGATNSNDSSGIITVNFGTAFANSTYVVSLTRSSAGSSDVAYKTHIRNTGSVSVRVIDTTTGSAADTSSVDSGFFIEIKGAQ